MSLTALPLKPITMLLKQTPIIEIKIIVPNHTQKLESINFKISNILYRPRFLF